MNPPTPTRDQCFNCGGVGASHIAMYCSDKLQQLLRCEDTKCWAACRSANDHAAMCKSDRKPSVPLGTSSSLHRPVERLRIKSQNIIERYDVGSKKIKFGPIGLNTTSIIAEDIEYTWNDNNEFTIIGPKTMYFRVLIAIGQIIIARVDVCCETSKFIRIPETNIESCRDVTKIQHTVVVLCIKNGETVVEAGNKRFSFTVAIENDNCEWIRFKDEIIN